MKKSIEDLYTHAGLENITERIVIKELYDFVQSVENSAEPKFCTCWICQADVAAIILNDIKPFYCSNFIDKNKNEEALRLKTPDIRERIVKAFEIIKESPHHE